METNKFKKALKGDKVYSLIHGEGIVKNTGTALIIIQFDNSVEEYYLNGKFSTYDAEPTLFWSKPKVNDPEPKRKVKKTITLYANVYLDSKSFLHTTEDSAKSNGFGGKAVLLAEPVTFEYEVYE